MTDINDNEPADDPSPYPDQSAMDLDMWRASKPMPDGVRLIRTVNEETVCRIPRGKERDAVARRIEMLGDVYEALRQAVDKMTAAGMDVTREEAVLAEFVTPKPFGEGL